MKKLVQRLPTTALMLVFTCLLAYPIWQATAAVDINWKRMQRDLDILEGVLQTFLEHTEMPIHNDWQSDRNTVKALYQEGYGVLLLAEDQDLNFYQPYRVALVTKKESEKTADTQDAETDVKVYTTGRKHIERVDVQPEDEVQKRSETLRKNLTEFLGTYGDAVGQLQDTDRITVLVVPPEGRRQPHVDYHAHTIECETKCEIEHEIEGVIALAGREKEHAPSAHIQIVKRLHGAEAETVRTHIDSSLNKGLEKLHLRVQGLTDHLKQYGFIGNRTAALELKMLEASVRKRDIADLKRGRMTEQAFAGRIAFREHEPGTAMHKKIDIMSGILDKALGGNGNNLFSRSAKTTGIYQADLGAVFFIDRKSSDNLVWIDKDEPGTPNSYETFKNALIETVADYGHTLRDLKPDEHIVIQADLSDEHSIHGLVRVVTQTHSWSAKPADTESEQKRPNRLILKS